MELGTIVNLQGAHWMLITKTSKRTKGVVTTKVFRQLRKTPNFAIIEKPYTHAREAICTVAAMKDLNASEMDDCKQLTKWKFNVREN